MKYFGTDGFRGEAGTTLTVEHAYKIGRYVGWYYGARQGRKARVIVGKDTRRSSYMFESGLISGLVASGADAYMLHVIWYYGARQGRKARVIVGKDTRRSSYMFESGLISGLVASGADAYMLHVIPTPGVAYETVDGRFDCGIMISASHNPYTDNGIKLMNCDGCKMDEEVLELIEDYIDGKSEVPFASGDEIGCTVDYMQGRNRYIAHLIASANFSLQGLKIGLDCANGSASSVAKPVFDALGADVRVINNAPDGFNINVDCGSTHMERLRRHVLEQGLDVGFAYDGDADRCLAVDDRGNVVDGDLILYVCGTYLHKHGRLTAGTVVPTVMSNLGLFKALDRANLKYETTPVGDKYVTACMREKGYSLGGEQSGHVIFGDIETTGDGIMTSLRIMEVMRAERMTLSELCAPVKIFPQVLVNVRSERKAELDDTSPISSPAPTSRSRASRSAWTAPTAPPLPWPSPCSTPWAPTSA